MKNSITIVLIIIIGIFGFVGGYSIGFKNGSNQAVVSNNNQPVTTNKSSTTESKPGAGGYGAPAGKTEATAPAAPGYGQ